MCVNLITLLLKYLDTETFYMKHRFQRIVNLLIK